jgi:ferric-chelate reductase [NAD(P)H]
MEINISALEKLNYGMYVVTACLGNKLNGTLVNTVFQVTAEPPVLAISLNKENYIYKMIEQSKRLIVCILTEEANMKFIGTFGFKSGKDTNKFENIKYKTSKENNCPIIFDYTCAYIEASLINIIEVGTHSLFCVKVENTESLNDKKPMTYSYYHEVIKGKTSKKAATYIKS